MTKFFGVKIIMTKDALRQVPLGRFKKSRGMAETFRVGDAPFAGFTGDDEFRKAA